MTKIKIILSHHLFSTVKAAKRTKLSQNDLLIMPLNQGVLSGVLGYFYEKSFSQHGIFWKVTAQKPLLKFFACPFCLTFFTSFFHWRNCKTSTLLKSYIRPWHDTWVIAHTHAVSCANQEKGGLGQSRMKSLPKGKVAWADIARAKF